MQISARIQLHPVPASTPPLLASSSHRQGLSYRPVWPNQRDPVPVYQTGLAGNQSKPVEVKFEFKILCVNGLTGLPVGLTGLPVGLTGNRPNSNFFFFGLNLNARKVY